jgi:SAM-dependent methyltransferase
VRAEFYRDYFEIEERHWWFRGRRAIFLRLLDRYLPQGDPGERRLLDVGCGSGAMLTHLERYGSPTGIESDDEAVRQSRQRGIDAVKLADAPPLPFEDESFDLVTALDVLEHVDDDLELLREVERTLRPGGMLLLSVPAYRFLWGLQDEVAQHRRRYVAREVRERVVAARLELGRLSYFNTILFPPIAIVRLIGRIRPPSDRMSDFDMTAPGTLNDLLARVFASESRLLDRVDLPFGVSVVGLAYKPGGPARGRTEQSVVTEGVALAIDAAGEARRRRGRGPRPRPPPISGGCRFRRRRPRAHRATRPRGQGACRRSCSAQ